MKVAFLGATKGMGRALARLMTERGDELFLLGRQVADLEKSAADLAVRSPTGYQPRTVFCDLEKAESFEPSLTMAEETLGGLDAVVVTAGVFTPQDQLEADPRQAERLLSINFTHTIVFCEVARKRLMARSGGTLCVFSSVAGDRGRKPVAIYGASKAGLSFYLEALDHKFRAQGLRTICVKPGFVKTGMTVGLKAPPFAGEPEPVARRVLRAIDSGQPVVYAPGIWRPIMLIIRFLPRFVMRRIGF